MIMYMMIVGRIVLGFIFFLVIVVFVIGFGLIFMMGLVQVDMLYDVVYDVCYVIGFFCY